jgi:hypothetical protein
MKTLIPAALIIFATCGLAQDVPPHPGSSSRAPLPEGIVLTILGQEATEFPAPIVDEELGALIDDALRIAENLPRAAKKMGLAANLAHGPGDDLALLWCEYGVSIKDLGRAGKRAPAWSPMGVSLDLDWERALWSPKHGVTERDRAAAQRSIAAQVTKVWLAEKAALEEIRSSRAFLASCHEALRIVRSGRIRGAEKGRVFDAVYGKLSKAEFGLRDARTELDRISRQLEILTGRSGRNLEERAGEEASSSAKLPVVKVPTAGPEGKEVSAVERALNLRTEKVRKALERATKERRASEALTRDGRGSLVTVLEAKERETGLEILSWNLWRERQARRVNLLLALGDTASMEGMNKKK